LIYKSGTEGNFCHFNLFSILAQSDLVSFPHTLWGVVESAENLTPRGLSNTFSSNDSEPFFNHSLDSFLLSKRRDDLEEEVKN
jgi:hypothetical protein